LLNLKKRKKLTQAKYSPVGRFAERAKKEKQQLINYKHDMTYYSKIYDNGCLTIRLAIAHQTYFVSGPFLLL